MNRKIIPEITARRSVRKYSDDVVPLEDIQIMVEAAMMAPNAEGLEPWTFQVINHKTIIGVMGELVDNAFDEVVKILGDHPFAKGIRVLKRYSRHLSKAPVIIAVYRDEEYTVLSHDPDMIQEIYEDRRIQKTLENFLDVCSITQSVSAGIQNILLQAEKMGYGSCWMTAPLIAKSELEVFLKAPKHKDLMALITLGVPDVDKIAGKRKKTVNEILDLIFWEEDEEWKRGCLEERLVRDFSEHYGPKLRPGKDIFAEDGNLLKVITFPTEKEIAETTIRVAEKHGIVVSYHEAYGKYRLSEILALILSKFQP